MNQDIDLKIRSILLENDINITDRCRNRIDDTINGLHDKDIQKWYRKLRPAAAIAVVCLLMTSVTVVAAINYVRQRMENLSQEEIDSYNTGLQDSAANADSYSRQLTDYEKERMEELKTEYENGTFPVQTLTIVETKADAESGVEFYFVEDTSLFVLPSRELTEEEMLEIIDFYYSRDYSLTEKSEQENTVIDTPKELIENGGIDEDKAIEMAKAEVWNIYGIDCKEYETTVEYDDAGGYGNIYRVDITDKETKSDYRVTIDADLKLVTEVYYTQENDYFDTGIKVDQDKYIEKYEDALNILTKGMGIEIPMLQSTCEYNYNSEGVLERGVVSYLFEMEDGTGYVMKYNCVTDVFFNIIMTDYNAYRKVMDQNDSKRKERGLERAIIQMQ
jgi:anti-sigma28 factor (negative regulator of flagellin synthesis)